MKRTLQELYLQIERTRTGEPCAPAEAVCLSIAEAEDEQRKQGSTVSTKEGNSRSQYPCPKLTTFRTIPFT